MVWETAYSIGTPGRTSNPAMMLFNNLELSSCGQRQLYVRSLESELGMLDLYQACRCSSIVGDIFSGINVNGVLDK